MIPVHIYILKRGLWQCDCGGANLFGLQPCILIKWFHMHYILKDNVQYSSGNLACSCVGFSSHSYSELMQHAPSTVFFLRGFSCNSYSNSMLNTLLTTLPAPVLVSHPILIQN